MTPNLRRMPNGKDERRSSPGRRLAAIARGPPTYRPPPRRRGWLRLRLGVACTPPDALPLPRVLYERHPQQPGYGGPESRPSVDTRVCRIFDVVLMSKEGVKLYAD